MTNFTVTGLDQDALAQLRTSGVDHGSNAVEAFVDERGDWPLRCCLTDSSPGERVAIVAWCPYQWSGPYAETGPVVIHTGRCPTPHDGSLPSAFTGRRQILRPYGPNRRIEYDLLEMVEANAGLRARISALLDVPSVDMVQARNPLSGCYSFTAVRSA